MLYGRLDDLREQTSRRLARVLLESGGTPQARSERDTATAMHSSDLAQYSAVENGLCFGRLDFEDGEHQHIGRIGIFRTEGDYEPLLMDWRAPAARPFYLATAASPDGVTRRRHIRTRRRNVVGLDDEVLDLAQAVPGRNEGLVGEATLLAAVGASRTGRMSDIVATIQAEQDKIIRSELNGVLVVQGGPGTGKTAVALHRAAYLLYTHRRQLEKRGVLVVGPNSTFLNYISQVLPSLGETGVLLNTVGELYPGLKAVGGEPVEVGAVKGRLVMADVLAAAVRDRQWVPRDGIEIPHERETLVLDRKTLADARGRARRSRRPHNAARPVFEREIIGALARLIAHRLGAQFLDSDDVADIRAELREDERVMAAIDKLWPILTPEQLLTDLYASEKRLGAAGRALSPRERQLLRRDPGAEWTPADAPLLDEAAELLGEDDRALKAAAAAKRRQDLAYAQGVLDILDLQDESDPDVLMAVDMLDADALVARVAQGDYLTAAERAADDRTWTFGHVIVDEAQELSEMAWRVLMRRCPSRSMTVVGDIAQTGDLAGTSSWGQVLSPYVANRWRLAELTVNYRTPAEIMAVATDVLASLDPDAVPPSSVRDSGLPPWHEKVAADGLKDAVAVAVEREVARLEDGRLAVLVPRSLAGAFAVGGDDLESPVVVLTVGQAKGLEFDSVLLVEPESMLTESPRGANDLYVAMTRATKRLGVLHTGELPAILSKLASFSLDSE
ncbi:DNA helicase IV [Kutzneria buriramensis]|uniref:DNA helicase IV n=2 Tax=Kutzneria buriramensis TaxID=1045776 RepID=A0A3E0HBM3_9PSEU|nr:UvrD-helicase domain-containing protein [Kutzneria buriramensis]REH41835.1 DNA helicase IV [Kutzneria buriramensis]